MCERDRGERKLGADLIVVVPEDVVWRLGAVLDQASDVHHRPLVKIDL